MKRILLGAFLLAAVATAKAQNIAMPQPSPTQTIKQNFSVGSIELSYSRPGLKGRKLGTDLAPYGKVWRTGANQATTLQFTDDVSIGGVAVKAGKYGLLSIPGATEWTLIISKDVNVNDPNLYKEANDVVRVKAPVTKLGNKVETFTINFANFTNNSADAQLAWENSMVSLPISINTDAIVMKQIDAVFNKDNKPYYAAAQYYLENGKDLNKAKQWIDIATNDPANAKAFYMFLQKARIYQKLGDKAGAKAAAEKTIALATEAKNDDYVKMATALLASLK